MHSAAKQLTRELRNTSLQKHPHELDQKLFYHSLAGSRNNPLLHLVDSPVGPTSGPREPRDWWIESREAEPGNNTERTTAADTAGGGTATAGTASSTGGGTAGPDDPSGAAAPGKGPPSATATGAAMFLESNAPEWRRPGSDSDLESGSRRRRRMKEAGRVRERDRWRQITVLVSDRVKCSPVNSESDWSRVPEKASSESIVTKSTPNLSPHKTG